jgi:hypothetical protein
VGGVGWVVDVTRVHAKHTGNAINAKTIKENNMFFFIVFFLLIIGSCCYKISRIPSLLSIRISVLAPW